MPEMDAVDILRTAASLWIGDGFTEAEATATIASGISAGRRRPRPGPGDDAPKTTPDVDLSGIMGGDAEIQANRPAPVKRLQILDAELFDCPGLVNDLAAFTLRTAPYPNRPLAFAAALSMQAFLCARCAKDPDGSRTNIYLVGLADAGVGKDRGRKVNTELADVLGILDHVGDRIPSGEGVEDALLRFSSLFLQADEIHTVFQKIAQSNDGSGASIVKTLLTAYTSSDSILPVRQLSTGAGRKMPDHPAAPIRQPHLTNYGVAIPGEFYGLATKLHKFEFDRVIDTLIENRRGSGRKYQHLRPDRDRLQLCRVKTGGRGASFPFLPLSKGKEVL